MNYIINESQFRLLTERFSVAKFGESARKMNSFATKLVKKVEKKYGLNLRLLSTWGPAVGGLVMPLDNLIKTGSFSLDENQAALILIGCAATIFFDNKSHIKSVIDKIKEEGIYNVFRKISLKSKELKNSFVGFIESLNVSITSLSEILSYAFLLPIIPDITAYITKTANLQEVSTLIAERLIASGVVLVATEGLTSLLRKAIERIKES